MNEVIVDSGTGESDTCVDEGDPYKQIFGAYNNGDISIVKIFDLLELVDVNEEN